MSDLTFYDAAWPPASPPATDGVCIYLAGDTPHPWTDAEIRAQKARYRLPVFVRSNPPGPGAAQDVTACLTRLAQIGAPHGTLVAWDTETSADPGYILEVYQLLKAAGYILIVYGTQPDVMGNNNPDDLYWGAQWSGVPHIAPGDAMTQYVSFAAFDESLAKATLPFWDTRPLPQDWTYGPPVNLRARPGHTSVELEWGEPAHAPVRPAAYNVFIYAGTLCSVKTIVKSYPRLVGAATFTGGSLERHRVYTAHVVAEGPDGTRVRPDVFASVTFTTG